MKASFMSWAALALAATLFIVSPARATNWIYDGSLSQKYLLDDTGWKFKITLNKKYYDVTGTQIDICVGVGSTNAPLDFSAGMPVEVGDIVALNSTFSSFQRVTNAYAVIRAVKLPTTITYIGGNTFRGCSVLETVDPLVPDSVVSIGSYAFNGCTKLKGHLKIGAAGKTVTLDAAGNTFPYCKALEEITIGDGVTSIPGTCFRECTSVTNVTLGANVASIGGDCFRGCTGLLTVQPFLPGSVTYLGNLAFNGCTKLKGHLVLGASGGDVTVPNQYQPFANCQALQEVTIGDGVTRIYGTCFRYCYALTNVNLGASLQTIDDYAFRDCTALKTVKPFLPDSVTSIGTYAFASCSALKSALTLGGGGADIAFNSGGFQFAYCSALTNIVIGAGVTSLPQNIFATDRAVKEVRFLGCPTWASSAFGIGNVNTKWNDYQSRFLVPSGHAGWIAFMNDPAKMKTWETVAPSVQTNNYWIPFGYDATEPKGHTVNEKQWVVVESGGGSEAKALYVTAEPGEYGTVTPAYGEYADVSDDLPLACSAPQYADNGKTRYECAGHVLSTFADEAWTDPQTNAATSFNYNPATPGLQQLKWLWEVAGYQIAAPCPEALGAVAFSDPDLGDFYSAGSTATLTATPKAGATFLRWYGDVTGAQVSNATVSLTMDAEKTAIPYFATDWVYDADAHTISDGYWTIPAAGERTALVLSRPTTLPATEMELDLRKPIIGGGAIVEIAANFLYWGSGTSYSDLVALRLPDTLRKVGAAAFRRCDGLVTIDPFLPASVVYLGSRCFSEIPMLESDLNLGASKAGVAWDSEGYQFAYLPLASVTLGRGVTNLPQYAFNQCDHIEEFSMLGDVRSLGIGALRIYYEGDALQASTFRISSYPALGSTVFQNWRNYRTRFHVPRGDPDWAAFLADPVMMMPWGSLGEADRARYTTAYPGEKPPKGLSTTAYGMNKQWIFTWDPKGAYSLFILR